MTNSNKDRLGWGMILGAYISLRISGSGVKQKCERIVNGTEALLQQKSAKVMIENT